MTTLAHAPGGLRPADLPFHPGLQLHAIQPPRADRRLSLLISVLCYEVVAAGVLLTLQHKEVIREKLSKLPPIVLTEAPDQAPPAPAALAVVPPMAGGGSRETDALQPPVRDPEFPSSLTPDTLPTTDLSGTSRQAGRPDGVVGGSGDPAPNGPLHGSGQSQGSPMEVSVSQLRILHRVDPTYPAMARITKQQGEVVLRMTIDASGVPSDVAVVSGPEIFRVEALRAARGWRFTPARVGGEAVPAMFNLTLRFVIR